MEYKKVGERYIIKIKRGEWILKSLKEFFDKEKIKNGFFIGLGAVRKVKLGIYNFYNKEYETNMFEEDLEINSLTGNVTLVDGKAFPHAHIVLGKSNFTTLSGHLMDGEVSVVCEIIFIKLDSDIEWKFDKETGLRVMELPE